jgi:hypothetical protein
MRRYFLILVLVLGVLRAEDVFGPLPPEETLELPGVAISMEHWDAYFGSDVDGLLVDPCRLLSSLERKEREEFLRQHADDSKIGLRVMIFKTDQRFPSELETLLAPQWSSGEPMALLLYRMGEPDRAELLFDPDLAAELSTTETRRLVGRSAMAAEKKIGALDQLKEFCVQVSIRLYWIEDSLGWVNQSTGEQKVIEPPAEEEVSRSEAVTEAFRKTWESAGLPAMIALSAIICFAVLRWVMRMRRRFRFPEFEMEPRLGGEHAAGIGAVIFFGSTTQSPSAQKSPTADCLGGI